MAKNKKNPAPTKSEPLRELAGFNFGRKSFPKQGRIYEVLANPAFTSNVQSPRNPLNSELTRMVSNNVAAIFRAMFIFRRNFGDLDFWNVVGRLIGLPQKVRHCVKRAANWILAARNRYVQFDDDCPTEAAWAVDKWRRFVDGWSGASTQSISYKEGSRRWKVLVDQGDLVDFGERLRTAPGTRLVNQADDDSSEGDAKESSSSDSLSMPTQAASHGKRAQSRSPKRSPSAAPKRRKTSSGPKESAKSTQAASEYYSSDSESDTGDDLATSQQQPPSSAASSVAGNDEATEQRIKNLEARLSQQQSLLEQKEKLMEAQDRAIRKCEQRIDQMLKTFPFKQGARASDNEVIALREKVRIQRDHLTKLSTRVEALESRFVQGNTGGHSERGLVQGDNNSNNNDGTQEELGGLAARIRSLTRHVEEVDRESQTAINDIYRRLRAVELVVQVEQQTSIRNLRLGMTPSQAPAVVADEHRGFSAPRHAAPCHDPTSQHLMRSSAIDRALDGQRCGASVTQDPRDDRAAHRRGVDLAPSRDLYHAPAGALVPQHHAEHASPARHPVEHDTPWHPPRERGRYTEPRYYVAGGRVD
ncbi:hypothetical protein VTJ83DRAFT_3087 [Remersonia thermophila]|uniref:Uncharacterized protein n=1 Tax=Remersonia thermophila TaxID=72144 RepID=A0ABR4DD19_9PEZI